MRYGAMSGRNSATLQRQIILEMGDQWVFVALDADSKLIPSYIVGKRSADNAQAFIKDLSERLDNRVQLSSDALPAYIDAVEAGFRYERGLWTDGKSL